MKANRTPSSIFYPRSAILSSRGPRAFSFAEVMFAVVILGVGFILIAAIFPVAIQQSQVTGEESNAAVIARQASTGIAALAATAHTTAVVAPIASPSNTYTSQPGTIANPAYDLSYHVKPGIPDPINDCKSVAQYPLFPPTVKNYVLGNMPNSVAPPAIVVPFMGTRWDLIKANAILPSDPRFAYAAFYKRENGSSTAELIVIAMTTRTRPSYDATDQTSVTTTVPMASTTPGDFPAVPPSGGGGTLVPTVICPDTISVPATTAQEGTSLQTNYALLPSPTPQGRTYSLGRYISGTNFELLPADAMALTAGTDGNWGTVGRIADAAGPYPATLSSTGTLQATVAYAQLTWLPGTPSGKMFLTKFPANYPGANPPPAAAVPGAFVIVADDFPFNPGSRSAGRPTAPVDYVQESNIPGFLLCRVTQRSNLSPWQGCCGRPEH